MDDTRWFGLMKSFAFEPNEKTFIELKRHYDQKNRHYHNQNHIDATLKQLDNARSLAENIKEIELALWFHDAIYKSLSSSNEADSGDWAVRFLESNGAPADMCSRVFDLIMATAHNTAASTSDQNLIIDVDLTILGSSPDDYRKFERNVRKEYRMVPGFLFRKTRKQILSTFIERDRIYHHEHFHSRFENRARTNLHDAIKLL